MSVDLQPAELGFRRPFDHEVTENLKLINSNSAPIAFKVKTTAPKQYCVRPNASTIPPNSSTEVSVLLQAMKEEPPLDAKCRDKFLVQSVLVPPGQDASSPTFWSDIEKTSKQSIQERKIRVNFLPAGGATPNGVRSSEEHPPAYTSPTPQYGSPAPAPAETKVRDTPVATESARSTAASSSEATGLAGAVAAVTNVVPTSTEELKQQLAAAQAQISNLTTQLQDPQLRQRKVQEANEKVQAVVQQSTESGVPLQIVAGLCLLSFLIAYLFF